MPHPTGAALATTLVASVLLACEPEPAKAPNEFQKHVKSGCYSLDECRKLVDEGVDRFHRCQYEPMPGGARAYIVNEH